MSRTLSTNSESLESLKLCERCGWDRDVIAWLATTAGMSGEMIRDYDGPVRGTPLRRQPRSAQGAVADRQRIDLCRLQDDRHRPGPEPRTLLYPSRKSGEQPHGRPSSKRSNAITWRVIEHGN